MQEKKTVSGYKARRWVVEVSHSWFNRFRKLLVRYEKLAETYMALLHMAAAIIAWFPVNMRIDLSEELLGAGCSECLLKFEVQKARVPMIGFKCHAGLLR
jgi:hypothetical protein